MAPEETSGIKEATPEETLQSIDSTLKRIEEILLNQAEPKTIALLPKVDELTNSLEKAGGIF